MVLDFTVASLLDQAGHAVFAQGLRSMLISELESAATVAVVERSAMDALLKEQDLGASGRVEPGTAARIGKLVGAQYAILGGFVIDRKNKLRLDARVVDVETSRIVHVETVSGSGDDIVDLTAKLMGQVNQRLKLPARATPASTGPTQVKAKPDLKVMQIYAAGVSAEERAKDFPKAKAYYAQFLKAYPAGAAPEYRDKAMQRLKALGGD